MDKKYIIYATGHVSKEEMIIECADIDDMTDQANSLLYCGCKEIRLVISE